jgi:hypothetical protein
MSNVVAVPTLCVAMAAYVEELARRCDKIWPGHRWGSFISDSRTVHMDLPNGSRVTIVAATPGSDPMDRTFGGTYSPGPEDKLRVAFEVKDSLEGVLQTLRSVSCDASIDDEVRNAAANLPALCAAIWPGEWVLNKSANSVILRDGMFVLQVSPGRIVGPRSQPRKHDVTYGVEIRAGKKSLYLGSVRDLREALEQCHRAALEWKGEPLIELLAAPSLEQLVAGALNHMLDVKLWARSARLWYYQDSPCWHVRVGYLGETSEVSVRLSVGDVQVSSVLISSADNITAQLDSLWSLALPARTTDKQ